MPKIEERYFAILTAHSECRSSLPIIRISASNQSFVLRVHPSEKPRDFKKRVISDISLDTALRSVLTCRMFRLLPFSA